jgi:hypothetical protein
MIKILRQTLVTEFLDDTTGEITTDTREFGDESVKAAKPKTTRKKKKNEWDDDDTPLLIREDNKLILNEAAVTAMKVNEGDRINIKMQVINRKRYPVIGLEETFGDKGGNLLTKSHTIRYGGKNNVELAKFGDIFVLDIHPKTDGLFVLKNKNADPAVEEENDAVAVSVQEELDELNSNLTDEETEMVDELDFNLNNINLDD